MGSQGNRILFGQPAIQPRIHWEGNHNNQNIPPNSRGKCKDLLKNRC